MGEYDIVNKKRNEEGDWDYDRKFFRGRKADF